MYPITPGAKDPVAGSAENQIRTGDLRIFNAALLPAELSRQPSEGDQRPGRGSNSQPPGSKPGALSIELSGQQGGQPAWNLLHNLIQCRRQDSNLHASWRVGLSHVCNPFHHSCISRVLEFQTPGPRLQDPALPRLHFRDSRLENSLGQIRRPGGSSQSQLSRLGPAEICRPGRRAGPGGEFRYFLRRLIAPYLPTAPAELHRWGAAALHLLLDDSRATLRVVKDRR